MKRNVSLEEISDGRLYGYNDMVKADCHGCRGCYQCCTGMGNSIVLDPCDIWRLQAGTGKTLQEFLEEGRVELNVVDGCILPNLRMTGKDERCSFLDSSGRCSIHESRPGICRLFPLGRYYQDGDFKYFLQVHECRENNRSKVKVSKWIDTPRQQEAHRFLCGWHELLGRIERQVTGREDSAQARDWNLALLKIFYFEPYSTDQDFYKQYQERLRRFDELWEHTSVERQ